MSTSWSGPIGDGKCWRTRPGSVWCGPKSRGSAFAPISQTKGIAPVKVIASSVRKGNVLDIDGKLYVVLTAESFHPGKGTPTTQIDMRRISDGVKTSQRYKTTEQVERAHVEDREHTVPLQRRRRLPLHELGKLRPDHAAGRSDRRPGRLSPAGNEGDAQRARGQRGGDRAAAEGDRSRSSRPSRPPRARPRRRPTSPPCCRTACAPTCRRSSAPARASW